MAIKHLPSRYRFQTLYSIWTKGGNRHCGEKKLFVSQISSYSERVKIGVGRWKVGASSMTVLAKHNGLKRNPLGYCNLGKILVQDLGLLAIWPHSPIVISCNTRSGFSYGGENGFPWLLLY